MIINRQRLCDRSREYIEEKVKEAIAPSLSALSTTQYGTTDKQSLVDKIFNYARVDVKNLNDTTSLHLAGNDDAIDKWYKIHFHGWIKKTGWIEKTNIGTNNKNRSIHVTTVGDEQKLTDDDNITHTGGFDDDKTPPEGTSEHQENTPKNLIDKDDNTQLPNVQMN